MQQPQHHGPGHTSRSQQHHDDGLLHRGSSGRIPAQIQQQMAVLESLRYEGEILNEKLIKLRATRHDLEAELFSLKSKRIQQLQVLASLEDEEMQLVSEVSSIIRFKRKVLEQVPHLEARGRASAALAVVQEYLLASVQHLQHLSSTYAAHQQQQEALGPADAAASMAAAAAAPSWSGTEHVPRPSAAWDMRYLPAALAPRQAAATQTDDAELEAAQLLLESLQLDNTEPPALQRRQQQPQQQGSRAPPPSSVSPPPAAQSRQYSSNPFASVTAGQLLQLQAQEGGSVSSDALPPLPEGQPLSAAAATAYSSSLYRSASHTSVRASPAPDNSAQRMLTDYQRSSSGNPAGPSVSRDSGSGLSLGSTASSGSLQRSGSITSRTSLGAAVVVGSPGGSSQRPPAPPPSRPSAEEVTSAGPSRQLGSSRASAGRSCTPVPAPPPPPPPPGRSRSGNLGLAEGLEGQGQPVTQHLQQLQQQYQQQQSLLRAQQHLQQQQQQMQAESQQEARFQSLLAHRQQLQLQHQQQQALLQHMAGLHSQQQHGFEASSAGSLDAASIPGSSLASLQSSATLLGVHQQQHSSALLRGLSNASTDTSLWGLPAGTLMLQGDMSSCDMSQAVAGLQGVLRQRSSLSAGRPSAGDMALAAAAAAAVAAAGLGQQQQQSQMAIDEALEFACGGDQEMVSRAGSGSSNSGQRLQLPPGGLLGSVVNTGPTDTTTTNTSNNLMVLLSPDGTGQQAQPGLYMQQHSQRSLGQL